MDCRDINAIRRRLGRLNSHLSNDCPFEPSWHHHRAHDAAYLVKYLPNGDVRYRRRT